MKRRHFTRSDVEQYFMENWGKAYGEQSKVTIRDIYLVDNEVTKYPMWQVRFQVEDVEPSYSRPFYDSLLLAERTRELWPSLEREHYLIPVVIRVLPVSLTVEQENAFMLGKATDSSSPS
jgi:hypothetical protein